MCDVKRCCFCIPLKAGVYIASAYTIFFSSLGLSVLIWMLANHVSVMPNYEEHSLSFNHGEQTSTERTIFIACSSFYGLWLLFGIMMMIGTANRVRGLLMPWIVLTSVIVAFDLLAIPMSLWYFFHHIHNHYLLINIGAMIGGTLLNIMSLVGASAHFQELGNTNPVVLSIYGDGVPAPRGQYKYHIQA